MEEEELYPIKQESTQWLFLLDSEGNPYPSDDISAVVDLMQDQERCRIGFVEKEIDVHRVRISTVFLAFNARTFPGPAIIYETKLFIDDKSVREKRYATKEEAQAGHAEAAKRLEDILFTSTYNQESIIACLD